MLGKDLSRITQEDLKHLIDNVVLEGKTIEYKSALPGNSDGDRKEFLADVSSFANAGGGDIIYGISEDRATREPKSLDGLDLTNVDQEKARLDNMIREGVEPRIPAVHIRPVILTSGNTAIIIRVGRSWVSPHRVIFKGHDKFYSRNSSGKYPLDVGELRIAFNLSEAITERIRRFREERTASLYANETPVAMSDSPKIVLHFIPVVSFGGQSGVYPPPTSHVRPMQSTGWNTRFTLEGFLNYSASGGLMADSYVHLYRNGIIESVGGSLIEPTSANNQDGNYVDSYYELSVLEVVPDYIKYLKEMDVPTPVIVFLTLVGVRGRMMRHGFRSISFHKHAVDRDVLFIPEIILEDYDINAAHLMKPIFDAVWNAFGYAKSFNYNDKGEWKGGAI